MDARHNAKKPNLPRSKKIIVLPRNFISEAAQNPLIRPVYPTDTGYFPAALNHYMSRPDGSSQNILIYCLSGEGFVSLNGKRRAITENTVLVIPKGMPHNYGASAVNPWSILWVHFLGTNAEEYFKMLDRENPTMAVPAGSKPKITELFESMIDILEAGYTNNHMICASHFLAGLLVQFFYSEADAGQMNDTNRIDAVIQHMAAHCDSTLTLDELAAHANLSATHFSYLFKLKTGFAPIDYFLRMKMQKACRLLDMTDLAINEIASRLGFGDPYYFSRAFRKIMQMSPSEYRMVKKG